MNITDFKPCPACNGQGLTLEHVAFSGGQNLRILCCKCGNCYGLGETTEEMACILWNKSSHDNSAIDLESIPITNNYPAYFEDDDPLIIQAKNGSYWKVGRVAGGKRVRFSDISINNLGHILERM